MQSNQSKGNVLLLQRWANLLIIHFVDGKVLHIISSGDVSEFELDGVSVLRYWPYSGDAPEAIPLSDISAWTLWHPVWEEVLK